MVQYQVCSITRVDFSNRWDMHVDYFNHQWCLQHTVRMILETEENGKNLIMM